MVIRQFPHKYTMRNVVFKPGESKSSISGGSFGRGLIKLMFLFFVLPSVFAVSFLVGGDIMLALLTVLVVGAMGYLVFSIFR
jgi:hypothetical protein